MKYRECFYPAIGNTGVMAVDYQLCLFVVWSINVFAGRSSSGYEQIFSRVFHGEKKLLWNTSRGTVKIKDWWPDPVFLHVIGRWNGAYFPSAQDYVGVPLRRNERSVFAPHDAPRLLLGITSEAFSFTVAFHSRKRTRRIFHATAESVNTILPHCWMCLKNQPTAGPSLPYCSKRLLPTFKLDPVPSNFNFTENTLPTRRDDSWCVKCSGGRQHWHIPPPGNSDMWQMTGHLSQLVWWRSVHYCLVMRTSVFEIFTGRKFRIPNPTREA